MEDEVDRSGWYLQLVSQMWLDINYAQVLEMSKTELVLTRFLKEKQDDD